MKANLFSFHVYLRQDGNIELQKESVRPDELQKEMDAGAPDYDGAHAIASLLRNVNSVTDEMIDMSRQYVS